jgi:hypothetical protein
MDDLEFSPGRITTDRYRRLYPENCLKTESDKVHNGHRET